MGSTGSFYIYDGFSGQAYFDQYDLPMDLYTIERETFFFANGFDVICQEQSTNEVCGNTDELRQFTELSFEITDLVSKDEFYIIQI